jgi:hypothetical protein
MVPFVSMRQDTAVRFPAVCDQAILTLPPIPFHGLVEFLRQLRNLHLLWVLFIKVAARKEGAIHEQGRVDRRKFVRPIEVVGLGVEKVIVKPMMPCHPSRSVTLRSIAEEFQSRERALSRFLTRDVAALDANGISRECKSHRSDARERIARILDPGSVR